MRNSRLVRSQRIINNSLLPFPVWKKGNYRRIKAGNISLTPHTYAINISVSVHTKPNFAKGHIRFVSTSIRRSISMVNKFQMFDYHQTSAISILISRCCPWLLSFLPVIELQNICAKRVTLQQRKQRNPCLSLAITPKSLTHTNTDDTFSRPFSYLKVRLVSAQVPLVLDDFFFRLRMTFRGASLLYGIFV